MEELQTRLGERAQWFRVGMMSATVLTPLITRWRSLRAAERTRDLWESSRAGARWPWAASSAEEELPPLARRQNLSTGIWLVGAGVGLVVAGTVAFVIARRRVMTSDEAPLELTLGPGSNGTDGSARDSARELVSRAAQTARSAAARDGTAATTGPDGAAAPTPLTPTPTPQSAEPQSAEPQSAEPQSAEPQSAEPQSAEPDEARYIGDVKTLVYHEADGDNLPAEENRVYFATQEQAESAGFRRAKGEVTPSELTR